MRERETGKEYYKEVLVRCEHQNCQLPRVRCAVVLAVVCQNHRGSDQQTGLDSSCRNTQNLVSLCRAAGARGGRNLSPKNINTSLSPWDQRRVWHWGAEGEVGKVSLHHSLGAIYIPLN